MMLNKKSPFLLFWGSLLLFCYSLLKVDQLSFKENDGFNVRHIFPNIAFNPAWKVEKLPPVELAEIDIILDQPFYYLGKGSHSFAFLSEDGDYVLKFHRYPSHMRVMPWLNRPFAYQFSKKRIQIKEHNIRKLDYNLSNYRNSYEDLQEEAGLIYVHPAFSGDFHRRSLIIDQTGNPYEILLDQVTFILQKRADLLYTTLDRLKREGDTEKSKQVISSMIDLFVACCQKGYIDKDPVLRKNYGMVDDRAIHIDIGDMVYCEEMKRRDNYIPHVKEMTESLRKRLVRDYPYLLEHYEREINAL